MPHAPAPQPQPILPTWYCVAVIPNNCILSVNEQSRWEGREVLQRGRHMFPFQYKVPEGVPCSFEGPDAHVRYTVQGIIIRYNGECISTQRTINVLREFDPSREPGDSSANSV